MLQKFHEIESWPRQAGSYKAVNGEFGKDKSPDTTRYQKGWTDKVLWVLISRMGSEMTFLGKYLAVPGILFLNFSPGASQKDSLKGLQFGTALL